MTSLFTDTVSVIDEATSKVVRTIPVDHRWITVRVSVVQVGWQPVPGGPSAPLAAVTGRGHRPRRHELPHKRPEG